MTEKDEQQAQTWDGSERRSNPARVAEVRLTDKTIEYLEKRMASAVSDGIKAAINEKTAAAFWSAGMAVLQRQATDHAGRLVLGGIKGLLGKAALFVVLGGIVYAIGGWSALARLFNALFGGGA